MLRPPPLCALSLSRCPAHVWVDGGAGDASRGRGGGACPLTHSRSSSFTRSLECRGWDHSVRVQEAGGVFISSRRPAPWAMLHCSRCKLNEAVPVRNSFERRARGFLRRTRSASSNVLLDSEAIGRVNTAPMLLVPDCGDPDEKGANHLPQMPSGAVIPAPSSSTTWRSSLFTAYHAIACTP